MKWVLNKVVFLQSIEIYWDGCFCVIKLFSEIVGKLDYFSFEWSHILEECWFAGWAPGLRMSVVPMRDFLNHESQCLPECGLVSEHNVPSHVWFNQAPDCQHLHQKPKNQESIATVKKPKKKGVCHWQRRFGKPFMDTTSKLSSAAHPRNASSWQMWYHLKVK